MKKVCKITASKCKNLHHLRWRCTYTRSIINFMECIIFVAVFYCHIRAGAFFYNGKKNVTAPSGSRPRGSRGTMPSGRLPRARRSLFPSSAGRIPPGMLPRALIAIEFLVLVEIISRTAIYRNTGCIPRSAIPPLRSAVLSLSLFRSS